MDLQALTGKILRKSVAVSQAKANPTIRPPPQPRAGPLRVRHNGTVESIRARLTAQKTHLENELERMSAPPDETSNISFGKRVGEGTSMAVDRLVQVETHDQLRALLADVTRAVDKFDEQSYGVCDGCGVDIPPERLEVLPWAAHCIRCAWER